MSNDELAYREMLLKQGRDILGNLDKSPAGSPAGHCADHCGLLDAVKWLISFRVFKEGHLDPVVAPTPAPAWELVLFGKKVSIPSGDINTFILLVCAVMIVLKIHGVNVFEIIKTALQ